MKKKTESQRDGVVERRQKTKLQSKCKRSFWQRNEESQEATVNENEGERIEWMGD